MKEEEKKSLSKVAEFEKKSRQEAKGEIERVIYFEKFQVHGIEFPNGGFVKIEKDVDEKISYHIYSGNMHKKVASVSEEGRAEVEPEFRSIFGDVDISQVLGENAKLPGIKAISQNIKSIKKEEIEDQQKQQKQVNDSNTQQQINEKKAQDNIRVLQEVKTSTKVNERHDMDTQFDLEKYNESDSPIVSMGIVYTDELKRLGAKEIPSTQYGIAAIRQDGTMQDFSELFEQDQSFGNTNTEKTMQVEDNGTVKKDASTRSRYRMRGTNETISIQKDIGGNVDIYYGGKGRENNEIIETQLRTSQTRERTEKVRESQSDIKGRDYRNRQMNEGNEHLEQIGEKKIDVKDADGDEKTKSHEHGEENLGQVVANDVIPGTNMTWEVFASECGYRGSDSIELAQKALNEAKNDEKNADKTNEEITKEVIENKQEEYGNGSRKR